MAKHKKKRNPVKTEPVAVGAIVAVIVTLGATFGLDLDAEAVAAVVSAAVVLIGLWQRSQVTPVSEDDPRAKPITQGH